MVSLNGAASKEKIDIPFCRPCLSGGELEYMQESVRARHISGDGDFTKKCHALLERITGSPKVLLTTSCTHALEMTALLMELKPGDEVIIPSFAFVSTVNAFALRGVKPIFIDVRFDTLNLDEGRLERMITPNTRAVVALHYAGVGCEMSIIGDIADRFGIELVEDNAHGLFGKYRGRNLGTFGSLAALSFHETKNITCGEGGALLLNDEEYFEQAEILREKGTNRSQFFRGKVEAYTWVGLGSSYLPSDMLAAFLLAQLESADAIQASRKAIWNTYHERLNGWADKAGVKLPSIPGDCRQSYHMFYMLCPSKDKRNMLIDHLKSRGILSVFHYMPLHLSPMGRKWGYQKGDCPVTEDISERLVRLPFFNCLNPEQLHFICDEVLEAGRTW